MASQGWRYTTLSEQRHHQYALRKATVTGLTPQQVYQYIDARESKIAARREVEILSHAYTKAVEWGYLDRHHSKARCV